MVSMHTVASIALALLPLCFGILLRSGKKEPSHQRGRKGGDDRLSFIVLADWGGLPIIPYHTYIESAVAKQMGTTADIVGSKLTLGLGDNFYYDGVKNIHDKRFKETYETVFKASSLDTPWFFVAGNHDHNGNVSAQIAYTDSQNRWNFPDYYYTLNYTISPDVSLEIIMIDTVILCGNSDDDYLHKQPEMPHEAVSRKIAEDHWDWIERTLSESTANYLIVAGHFPVFSVAEHGSTKCLVDRLFPLLHKFRVQAYMCGHDHNLQHIEVTSSNWTTEYVVVGAANFIEDSQAHIDTIPADSLKFYWADVLKLGGFGVVEADKDVMTFRFIDAQNGNTLHGLSIYPLKDRHDF